MKKKPELTNQEINLILKIKKERINKEITQKELANRTGLTQGFIAQFENLMIKPANETVQKISTALNYRNLKKDYRQPDLENFDYIYIAKKLIANKEEYEKLKSHNYGKKIIDRMLIDKDRLTYGYIMPDDSMLPEIKKNDIVIIEYTNIDFSDLGAGVIIILKDKEDVYMGTIKSIMPVSINKETGELIEGRSDEIWAIFINLMEKEKIVTKFLKNNDDVKVVGIVVAIISEKVMDYMVSFLKP